MRPWITGYNIREYGVSPFIVVYVTSRDNVEALSLRNLIVCGRETIENIYGERKNRVWLHWREETKMIRRTDVGKRNKRFESVEKG